MMRYIIWFVYSALIITFLHTSSESQYYLPLIMFFSSMFVWRLWWEESWWYLESSEGCWIYLPKSTSKQEQRLDQSWAESPGHHQNVEVRSCQRTRKYEEVVQGTRRKTLLNKIFCLQKDIWIEKCTVYPPRCAGICSVAENIQLRDNCWQWWCYSIILLQLSPPRTSPHCTRKLTQERMRT